MNKANKYLPYDSLEGYRNHINKASHNAKRVEMPILSDDQREAMDELILDCYRDQNCIALDYYEEGFINRYYGAVDDIDIIKSEIILSNKKRFKIKFIVRILAK